MKQEYITVLGITPEYIALYIHNFMIRMANELGSKSIVTSPNITAILESSLLIRYEKINYISDKTIFPKLKFRGDELTISHDIEATEHFISFYDDKNLLKKFIIKNGNEIMSIILGFDVTKPVKL